jgi:hypothetical protein
VELLLGAEQALIGEVVEPVVVQTTDVGHHADLEVAG